MYEFVILLYLPRLCDLKGSAEDLAEKSTSHLFLIKKGLATAFYIYAHCLRYGKGVEQNDVEAAKWYEQVCILYHTCHR